MGSVTLVLRQRMSTHEVERDSMRTPRDEAEQTRGGAAVCDLGVGEDRFDDQTLAIGTVTEAPQRHGEASLGVSVTPIVCESGQGTQFGLRNLGSRRMRRP